jgi:hypothetical protein
VEEFDGTEMNIEIAKEGLDRALSEALEAMALRLVGGSSWRSGPNDFQGGGRRRDQSPNRTDVVECSSGLHRRFRWFLARLAIEGRTQWCFSSHLSERTTTREPIAKNGGQRPQASQRLGRGRGKPGHCGDAQGLRRRSAA